MNSTNERLEQIANSLERIANNLDIIADCDMCLARKQGASTDMEELRAANRFNNEYYRR